MVIQLTPFTALSLCLPPQAAPANLLPLDLSAQRQEPVCLKCQETHVSLSKWFSAAHLPLPWEKKGRAVRRDYRFLYVVSKEIPTLETLTPSEFF